MERIKQIVFTKPNTAEFLDMGEVDFENLAPNRVIVKTYVSTLSAGTERANITGSDNISPGVEKATFPRYLGYSLSGVVVKVGSAVTKVVPGDRVVVYSTCQHKTYNTVKDEFVVKIEDDAVSFEDAAIAFIASFPLAAIRKVRLEIGESLLVMGLGILGQIAVKLAKSAGAYPIIACDPIKERREEALKNGADYAFDPLEEGLREKVRAVTGKGVKTAIEVTGVGAGLDETLDCMAKFGRVALLGCTRNSNFSIDFYQKVHCRGVTLIGAHTNARAELESSPSNFTHIDDIKVILNLSAKRNLALTDIIKEIHNPENSPAVYDRLVNDKSFPVGVQFDWRLIRE